MFQVYVKKILEYNRVGNSPKNCLFKSDGSVPMVSTLKSHPSNSKETCLRNSDPTNWNTTLLSNFCLWYYQQNGSIVWDDMWNLEHTNHQRSLCSVWSRLNPEQRPDSSTKDQQKERLSNYIEHCHVMCTCFYKCFHVYAVVSYITKEILFCVNTKSGHLCL